MRAFSFDKEPAFKSLEATSIWGSLISAGASLVGGAMGADAAKDAGKKQYAATKQQLALQKKADEEAKGYLSPYVARGNRADAFLDAMTYGEGSYLGAPGGGVAGYYDPMGGMSIEDVLRQQHPTAWAQWLKWESNDKGKANGHRAVYGDFEGFVRAGDPTAIQRAQDTLVQMRTEGVDGAGATKVTREDAFANLRETLPWQFNEQDYTQREALNEEDYAKFEALNEEDYLKAQGFTDAEIAAWAANAEAERGKSIDALFNRGGLTGQVGATRRGVAQVGEEFARDRAQYEAGRRRADYDPYAERRVANYDQYGKRRATNYDTYAGGRLSAYGGYLDLLGGDSDRGYEAATGIASGGQTYANNAGRLIGDGARAQAQAGLDSSKPWASGVQGAVGYLADAWGGRKPAKADSGYQIPESYDDYTSVSDSYRGYDDYGAPSGYFSVKPKRAKTSNMYAELYN